MADRMNLSQARVVDPILMNHARGYKQDGFIGDLLFPLATMPARAAKRIEFGREAFRRYIITRAPGGEVAQVGFGYEGKPVQLRQRALASVIPIEHMEEAAEVPDLDLQTIGVDTVLAVIALDREVDQATTARNAAAYAASNKLALAGADKWSDPASKPGQAVEDANEVIRKRTGRRANLMVIGAPVAAKLRHHPDVKDRFKHTTSSTINDEMLAQYFNVAKVAVGDAIYDDEAGNSVDVWGNDAILAYAPMTGTPNINIPAYGYTYHLRNHPLVTPAEWSRKNRSWASDVIDEWSAELVGPDAGFLFQAAV
jgi:hypothetical protein